MTYKKLLIFKAAGKVAATYGDKWARTAGDRAVRSLSRMAARRGWLDGDYDLNTLTEELKRMHRQGRFSAQEWEKVKEQLRRAWQNRNKPD